VSRRIVAGFIGVLLGLLVLVVVPLGLKISSQQRHDFRASAQSTADALANSEEERLGDTRDANDSPAPAAFGVAAGDGVVIVDRRGTVVATAGQSVPAPVVAAARSQQSPAVTDHVVVTARIGAPQRSDGLVVLVRDGEPLDQRIRALWLALAAAAVVTLALGTVTAAGLARWIGRPLRGLTAAATRMGHGDVSVRADAHVGPPEVRAVSTAFNEMAQRLGDLLASQRTMTADVSHQLRTPLAALQLRLELLAEESTHNVQAELTDALREIGRLNRLLDGLLAVARAEELTAEPVETGVDDLVAERVEMWQPLASERGVNLAATVEPAAALVTPGHLEQVLDNLIANAMDAASAGGHVMVSLRRDDDDVVLTVADDGPGMPAQRRANAFVRFESDRSGRKSGLGLAIVARLIAADHGSVALEERSGGGLSALVRLPATTR
jgi:signal transduction histidine kinase